MSTMNAGTHERAASGVDVPASLGRMAGTRWPSIALVSLGVAYVLSWMELGLTLSVGLPGDAAVHPLAASIVSRGLVGVLYLCVAANLQWARWLTVLLGFACVAVVAPMLAVQWQVFPAAALVSGSALVCKLSASLFLLSARVPKQ
jgi:hypothetical protein